MEVTFFERMFSLKGRDNEFVRRPEKFAMEAQPLKS